MSFEIVSREDLAFQRSIGPVVWNKQLHCWVVTSYDLVSECLQNSIDLASNFYQWHLRVLPKHLRADYSDLNNLPAHVLTEQDGVYHDHIKKFITSDFNSRVRSFHSEIDDIVESRIEQLGNEFDYVTEFANPVSEKVMCSVIGLSGANQDDVIKAATNILVFLAFDGSVPQRELIQRAENAKSSLAYMETLLEEEIIRRQQNPKDDLISLLVHKEIEYGEIGLSHQEIAYQLLTLMLAGFITTQNFLSLAMYRLLKDENQYLEIVQDPKKVNQYVNVLFRIETPSTFVMRFARNPLTLAEISIERGQMVLLHLDSANHDEKYLGSSCPFANKPKKSGGVTFGEGDHICTGMALARLVANKCFASMVEHFPGLRLGEGPVVLMEEFPVIRGVKSLPLSTGENSSA